MKTRLPQKSAFTLIELLIVIAIIGILMGLLFPAVNGVINTARKLQSKNDVVQIASAVTSYETDYGKLPITNSGVQDVGSDLTKILAGYDQGGKNPRKTLFMEIPAQKGNKSGTNTSGVYVDPWNQEYKIIVDENYDYDITGVPGVTGTLRKRVVVWGIGIPKKGKAKGAPNYEANTDTNKFVKSWE